MPHKKDEAPVRDRDRLRDAFAALRKRGYWSRSNQEDGWAAVPVDVLRHAKSVVFWHANETNVAFDDFGDLMRPLHLHHFVRDAHEIAAELGKHGLANVRVEDDSIVVVHPVAP